MAKMYRVFDEKMEKMRRLHMSILNQVSPGNTEALGKVNELGLKLLLYSAYYKCEKCGKEEFLTRHHMIYRKFAEIMHAQKYLRQRNYYGNQVLLCKECHDYVHNFRFSKEEVEESDSIISKEKIAAIKQELEG